MEESSNNEPTQALVDSDGEVLLAVENLVKNFGGLRAVNHCSLEVRRGTITGLIGPNGAGKTTLFSLITGAVRPDAGHVWLSDRDVTAQRPDRIFASGMSRTFQTPREHGSMSLLENLMLVPEGQVGENIWNAWFRPRAVRRQEEQNYAKAREVVKFLDLEHVMDEYAANLSGGQKKLLELGRILMAEPEMVLLDEPGAGVNRTLLKKITDNVEYLCRERGLTFLLIEHDMNLIMRLCTPIIVMSEGRKLMQGTPEEVRNDPNVLEAYLGGQYAAASG